MFFCVCSRDFVLIDRELRELWRFLCSFAWEISALSDEIRVKSAQNRAICLRALFWAPSSTLFWLNNKEIQTEIDFKRFWSILKEIERKSLKIARKTQSFRCLNACPARHECLQELRAIIYKSELLWCRNEWVWMINNRKVSKQNFDVPCQDLIELPSH